MPVVKRGFLFTYFDKIVCGVVALGVLAAIGFAVLRASSEPGKVPPEQVAEDLRRIEQALRGPAPPVAITDWKTAILDAAVRPLKPIRIDVIYPPLNQRYARFRAALDTEFTLEFKEPLIGGSVTVVGPAGLLRVLEHPLGGDYKRVKVRSFGREGEANVVGDVGSVKHLYPVLVSKEAERTAFPPSNVKALRTQGSVVLEVQPNKANDDDGVQVVAYEVWRRDWADPLGDYSKVQDLGAQESARRTPAGFGAAAMPAGVGVRPGVPPFVSSPAGMGTGAPVTGLTWEDAAVTAGQSYSYKVRTRGGNSFPAEGEFTAPLLVKVSPNVDFQFSRSTARTVGFDVAKLFTAGEVAKETFWSAVGDEIGGTARDPATLQQRSFETQYALVDFQRSVVVPGVGVTDRVVYADQDGSLRVRLRNQTGSDLWDMIKRAAPGVPGFLGAPTGLPGAPGVPGFGAARLSGAPGRRR